MRVLRSTLGTLESVCIPELGDEGCAQLASIFECEEVLVPQITTLVFSYVFQNSGSATRVFQAMGKATAFKSVRKLSILQHNLTTSAFQALTSTLKSDVKPSLETFSLYFESIERNNLATLLEGLEESACAQNLRELDLSKCGICAEGAKVSGLALERHFLPSLEKINLSSNDLGNDGLRLLTQSLQASSLKKLTLLELKHVGMDDVGRKSLAEAVKSGAFGNTRIWS